MLKSYIQHFQILKKCDDSMALFDINRVLNDSKEDINSLYRNTENN